MCALWAPLAKWNTNTLKWTPRTKTTTTMNQRKFLRIDRSEARLGIRQPNSRVVDPQQEPLGLQQRRSLHLMQADQQRLHRWHRHLCSPQLQWLIQTPKTIHTSTPSDTTSTAIRWCRCVASKTSTSVRWQNAATTSTPFVVRTRMFGGSARWSDTIQKQTNWRR